MSSNRAEGGDLILYGSGLIDRGQWWRLLSFMMMPSTTDPLWLFFAFYIFYLVGSSLEHQWGTFRFNLFILTGYLLTVVMAFINQGVIITNTYFLGCAFLEFVDGLMSTDFFINYGLFFGRAFIRNFKAGQRRKAFVAETAQADAQAMHVCKVCGITDKTHPTMDFRYCSTCGECFCEEHINNHEH